MPDKAYPISNLVSHQNLTEDGDYINIRNFTIISHIDHGKSTLADRFLELTGTIPKEKISEQYLDKMSLEREHGITIKMHPVRMNYILHSMSYILNLIDTPGHVDFSYEVSRALAAVEGAVLLVDATKGIQAQTVANLELARKERVVVIPVINKIDLPQAKTKDTEEELFNLLPLSRKKILKISAKKGIRIKELLSEIIEKIPAPESNFKKPPKAIIFDSKYDQFQGVVAYVRLFEGRILKGDKIYFLRKKTEGEVKEIGYFSPELTPKEELSAGEIGYIKTGIKDPEKVRVGDTIVKSPNINIEPLSGYEEPKPIIFTSVFPQPPTTFEELKKAILELHLSDPSFIFEEERKKILGAGFRCGFLGILHFQIIVERLRREFSLSLLSARPTISYKIIDNSGKEYSISSTEDWPNPSIIKEIKEPWAKVEIITPQRYFNDILQIFPLFKINFLASKNFGQEKLKIYCEMPFRKLIENFYDKLKNVSQGFASINFKVKDWRKANLSKLDILIAKEREPALAKIVEDSETEKEGRIIVKKLKEIFPPQLFALPLQAAVGGKIIARETIKARRKDVTGPLYGGDITRKMKLLRKQKKGKKRLEKEGKVRVPNEVIIELLKK